MGWAPPGPWDREVSPSSIPGMASCRDNRLVTWMLLPALGPAAQGIGLEIGGMCLDVGAVK